MFECGHPTCNVIATKLVGLAQTPPSLILHYVSAIDANPIPADVLDVVRVELPATVIQVRQGSELMHSP